MVKIERVCRTCLAFELQDSTCRSKPPPFPVVREDGDWCMWHITEQFELDKYGEGVYGGSEYGDLLDTPRD